MGSACYYCKSDVRFDKRPRAAVRGATLIGFPDYRERAPSKGMREFDAVHFWLKKHLQPKARYLTTFNPLRVKLHRVEGYSFIT